jgi:hypothetical protein
MAEFIKQLRTSSRKLKGSMKGVQTDHTEMREGRVNRNEWTSLPGRLDALGNKIKGGEVADPL